MHRIIIYLVLMSPVYSPAHAATPLATKHSEAAEAPQSAGDVHAEAEKANDKATLEKIENYLTGLSTIETDFTQVAPDAGISTGKFYLARPGKMRWEYDPPTPILMVTNGAFLVYYDKELEQVSHIPLDSTLVTFIAEPEVRFNKKVKVEKVEDKDGIIRVLIAQAKKEQDGTLMLEFERAPLKLRNMIVTDAQDQTTNVSFSNARFGVPLDEDLFIFKDPRKPKKQH